MAENNIEIEFIKDYLDFLLNIQNDSSIIIDDDIKKSIQNLSPENIKMIYKLFETLYSNGDKNIDLEEYILNEIKNG